MKRAARIVLPLVVAVLSLLALASCNQLIYYLEKVCKVYGRVTVAGSDGEMPIGSVEVFVDDYQYSELTNYYGDYEVELAEGTWTINFVKEGYEPFSAEITVSLEEPRVQLDVELVWIAPPVPIDLNGFWDLTLVEAGEIVEGPFEFYIKQTGTELYASPGEPEYAFSGEIDGNSVSFTGAGGTLVGTLSPDGDTIGGSIDEGPYSGLEFYFTRSTFPFGHISLSGTCAGVPISLDTDLGRANREVHNSESFRFDVLLGSGTPVGAGLAFDVEDVPLEVGNYTVVQWGDWDEEELPNPPIHATLWMAETYEASGGTVTIDSYVGSHIVGSFALEFQDGSILIGSFNSNFGSSGTSYLAGTWQGDTFDPGNTHNSSWSEYWSGTSFNLVVDFWDLDLSVQAWFTFPGYVTAGTYTKSPTSEEFWGHFSWEPVSGPQANGEIAATSTLYLDYYDGSSMSGSFDLSFMEGGSVHGEFEDLLIVEW